jgi:hypothetical protein
VYDTMGQGPFGWHEQRLAEYDVVALDVCSIVGTASTAGGIVHNRRWFRNYFAEPVGGPGTCDAAGIDLAYVPAEAQCAPVGTAAAVVPDQAGSSLAADAAVPVAEVASPATSPFLRVVPAIVVAGIVSTFLA